MMSYYYHHYHIYHHTQPSAGTNNYNTANTINNNNDFVDKSEEFHVYDHCRPIPEDARSQSRTPSIRNRNG